MQTTADRARRECAKALEIAASGRRGKNGTEATLNVGFLAVS